MKQIRITVLAFFLFGALSGQESDKKFELAGQEVTISGEFREFGTQITTEKLEDGLEIAKINLLHAGEGASPPRFTLKWKIPSSNIAGYWSSSSFTDKTIGPDWSPSKVRSMLAREAPAITLFGHDDNNRLSYATSEVLNTVTLSVGIREEDGMVYNQMEFFADPHKSLKSYEVQVRFDARPIIYSQAIAEISKWWTSFEEFTPSSVPEVAKKPVYSTWYSYHQNVSMEPLLEECKRAKEMGFESIIVDDGWQTLDSNRGYAFTGDWEPERIPEMKEFVQAVHDLDMKFILWYAVPFVGEKSKAYEQMKGKFLRYWDGQGTYVLDPRYPEVREFVINTYASAVKEWDLDGFKLDFIARFTADENTELTADDGRDYASVNEATDVLMTELIRSLREIKPDIMIEFRQPYAGPAMRKYGNMLRAADCPNLSSINRIRTTDLRLLSETTAVHSDMLMWHYDEPVEVAALQLLNSMFSVPQISVRLADIPDDHFRMIRFYTDYWLKNQETLIGGSFHATSPLTNYPAIQAWKGQKKIVALFNDLVVTLEAGAHKNVDVLNAKSNAQVVINIKGDSGSYEYTVFDCQGKEIKKDSMLFTDGIYAFDVPPSGLIAFKALD